MKKVIFILVLALFAGCLWGQSNEMLDSFLELETAETATSLMLIAQSVGALPVDAQPSDGYAWALEQDFAKYVEKTSPDEPISLGLFYLALLKSYKVRGGLMFHALGTPRYAAQEAGFMGYVQPSDMYYTRSMAPYEVLTGITYVMDDAEGGKL